MTTTSPSSPEHEPDPRTRQYLWRLRARLVTPPPEQRTREQLDELLALASAHAHDEPLADATARPGFAPVSEDVVTLPVRSHRPLRVTQVGRAAAAVALVVAVGSAAAIARDGGDVVSPVAVGDLADEPPAEPVSDDPAPAPGLAVVGDDPVPGDEVAGDPASDALVPDGEVALPAPSDDEVDPTDAPDGAPEPAAPAAPAAPRDPDGPRPPAPAPEEAPADDEPADPPVIAAPAPDGVTGSGGAVPCDADRLADCLDDDDPGSDADVDDDAGSPEADDLADRRSREAPE